jgi:predicted signal transduction protein with EAL and GGDEF domain
MTPRTPRILVADDDGVSLLVTQAALESAGFDVTVAVDGSTAVEQFKRRSPDCVILDVVMPGMDGFETCRAIRASANGKDTPVLILTSRDDMESVASAYDSGATDFTTKGISGRLLVERVRFLLRGYQAMSELIVSRSRLRMVQEMTRVGQWEVDDAGRTLYVSHLVRSLLSAADDYGFHLGQFASALRATDSRKLLDYFRIWQQSLASFRLEVELASGTNLHIHGITTPGTDAAGRPRLTMAVQDISALRRAQRQAYRLANFDTLTGLPNRRQFLDSLTSEIRHRDPGTQLALLVFRLQGLDRLQQSLGQAAIDAALVKCAGLIAETLGDSDATAFSHLGGGEFAFHRPGCNSPAIAAGIAEDVARTLGRPISGEGWTANFTLVTGIVMWPVDGEDAETLLENARGTAARHAATAESRYEFFTPEVQLRARRLNAIESAMHGALERGELSLAFQPRMQLADCTVRGAEALMRWSHPELGEVSPAEFIPVAEESGLIAVIGSWALHEACRQAASWRDRFGRELIVSVNVSPHQLRAPRILVADIIAALERSKLPANALEIELTESVMINAAGEALAALQGLRDQGISIALDDFGTGYSSLSYLRRLPADCLKIDRSFTADLAVGTDAERILQAIIGIARALRLRTVVEGVATTAQLEIAAELGCDEAQGFLFARPLDAESFSKMLASPVAIDAGDTPAAA